MSEIKYTTDGKKVVVIGNLNSQERIVQEIFIVGGQEVPSGENFVVKSLHDAPAISWKDAELKKLKERNELALSRLESETKQYEKQLEDRRKKFKEDAKRLSDKTRFIGAALQNADESSFNTIIAFIEGRIKWLVKNQYNPTLVSFAELVERETDSEYWSSINLISLFGNDDGTLQFKVGDAYDGYKTFTSVIPFETKEDALVCLSGLLNAKAEYNETTVHEIKKHGFKADPEKLAVYIEKQKAIRKKNVDWCNGEIQKHNQAIEDLDNLHKDN